MEKEIYVEEMAMKSKKEVKRDKEDFFICHEEILQAADDLSEISGVKFDI